MKAIYLASPYSHKDRAVMNSREHLINVVAANLIEKYGYMMFLPITQSAPLERILPKLGGSFAKWKKIDLEAISRMDELWVVMLEGWEKSIGVKAEIKHAQKLKKPVYYIDPHLRPLQLRTPPKIADYIP